ncbi:MAG: class I SAM-dependent methyltransferase [Planctomycetota bacterium]
MTSLFNNAYSRDDIAYGLEPSASLEEALKQYGRVDAKARRRALDLAAGAGRDTLALAGAGYQVDAVDLSEEGLKRIEQRAEERATRELIETHHQDAREFVIEPDAYDFVIGTTMLDHIPSGDADALFESMVRGLSDRGTLFIEVHSTSDPACDVFPGSQNTEPVSETASAVVNYFPPGRLALMALQSSRSLRILQYEERLEWDYTHGGEHQHGKAILLATLDSHFPSWYGQPAAFPRQVDAAS